MKTYKDLQEEYLIDSIINIDFINEGSEESFELIEEKLFDKLKGLFSKAGKKVQKYLKNQAAFAADWLDFGAKKAFSNALRRYVNGDDKEREEVISDVVKDGLKDEETAKASLLTLLASANIEKENGHKEEVEKIKEKIKELTKKYPKLAEEYKTSIEKFNKGEEGGNPEEKKNAETLDTAADKREKNVNDKDKDKLKGDVDTEPLDQFVKGDKTEASKHIKTANDIIKDLKDTYGDELDNTDNDLVRQLADEAFGNLKAALTLGDDDQKKEIKKIIDDNKNIFKLAAEDLEALLKNNDLPNVGKDNGGETEEKVTQEIKDDKPFFKEIADEAKISGEELKDSVSKIVDQSGFDDVNDKTKLVKGISSIICGMLMINSKSMNEEIIKIMQNTGFNWKNADELLSKLTEKDKDK